MTSNEPDYSWLNAMLPTHLEGYVYGEIRVRITSPEGSDEGLYAFENIWPEADSIFLWDQRGETAARLAEAVRIVRWRLADPIHRDGQWPAGGGEWDDNDSPQSVLVVWALAQPGHGNAALVSRELHIRLSLAGIGVSSALEHQS